MSSATMRAARLSGRTVARGVASSASAQRPSLRPAFGLGRLTVASRPQFAAVPQIHARGFASAQAVVEEDAVPEAGEAAGRKWRFFEPVEVRENGVAIIRLNGPGKMNVVSDEMRLEAERMWAQEVEGRQDVRAVVFLSSKKDNFIAGADINMIKAVEDKRELKDVCMNGHAMFDKISAKGVPIVAAINGACLGGGLEWALHCDYRIASTSPKTVLGLPEVKLGLLPGWGGTQLLHPLVGLQAAMDVMLTGKNIRPDKALKMGLVDQIADPASLEAAAVAAAAQLADKTLKPRRKPKALLARILEDTAPGRSLLWRKVEEMVDKNTGGHYPSPKAIIAAVKFGLQAPTKRAALEFEADRFAEMAATPQSAALIGLFDGATALKKNRFGAPAHKVETVAVLGAGLMGAGIAQVSAEKGLKVLLKDRDAASVGRGTKQIAGAAAAKLKKRRMTRFDADLLSARIVPLTDDGDLWKRHFAKADMVIEAVPEDLALKHRVIKQVEPCLPDYAVFATNTSALPIADIAQAAQRPENVVGMHYFSPVPMMPLLEVIPHAGTARHVSAAAVDVGNRQGKTAIVVKDVPGFYVNRCLGPFLVETCALIADGVGLERLDKAMKDFGLPVGPITLADEVGVDIAFHVQSFLSQADMGVRMTGGDTEVMGRMVAAGMLGRKAGRGFYLYENEKKGGGGGKGPRKLNPEAAELVKSFQKKDLGLGEKEMQDRMMSRFVNEAVLCLQDGIIESPVDGDIGAVFGMGFPPFLGGPFRMLDLQGVARYHDLMAGFADKYGEQFRPCQLLADMAKENKKFYGS